MSRADLDRLVSDILIRAISIAKATNEKRSGDVKTYTDEIRRLLREALAE